MIIDPDLSYTANALLACSAIGSFFAGRRSGRHEAETATNQAQSLTIEAQTARIDLLESEKAELQEKLESMFHAQEQMQIKLKYLEELVLRGTSAAAIPAVVVQQGAVPDVRGGRRQDTSGNPQGSGDGSIR